MVLTLRSTPSLLNRLSTQEGWLLKKSGGKNSKASVGNALQKWDKRWFTLRGGDSVLSYHKSDKDADRGKPAAGEISCVGCKIERIHGNVGVGTHSEGWEVAFAVNTEGRVLTLRTDSEDSLSLWVGAIVAAGGAAEADLLGSGSRDVRGKLAMTKSGRLDKADLMNNLRAQGSGRMPNTPSGRFRALTLPDDFDTRPTLDTRCEDIEDWMTDGGGEAAGGEGGSGRPSQEGRKSFLDVLGEGIGAVVNPIGEGIANLIQGGSGKLDGGADHGGMHEVQPGSAAEVEASGSNKLKSGHKRDTPANLPSIAPKKAPASRLSTIAGFSEDEDDDWGDDDDDERPDGRPEAIAEADEADDVPPLRVTDTPRAPAEPTARELAAAATTWPMVGWLHKQSGGKIYESKTSFGNALAKWDRRYFVIREGACRPAHGHGGAVTGRGTAS